MGRGGPASSLRHEIADALARHFLAVDEKHAAAHGDLVARQTYQALDVVGGVVARQLEDDDVAALGLGRKDAAAERDQVVERIAAVAVGELGDEQVVADLSVSFIDPDGC